MMTKPNDDLRGYEKMLEEAGELLYERTLREIEELEADDTIEGFDEEALANVEAQAMQELQERLNAKTHKMSRRKWLAAVAVICLVVVGSTVLIAQPTVSYPDFIEKLFSRDGDDSTTISISTVASIPENWSGKYAPMDIPREYEIATSENNQGGYGIQYNNSNDDYIIFAVYQNDSSLNLDTENCATEDIMIDETKGIYIFKQKTDEIVYYRVVWQIDDLFCSLMSDCLARDTLIDIAESVMLVQ